MPEKRAWRTRLWRHQRDALECVEKFLRVRGQRKSSTLIRMPTGAGKTAIVAATAHEHNLGGHALVVTPWEALVKQLTGDLQRRFWSHIGVDVPTRRRVTRLLPATAAATLEAAKRQDILVATLASLRTLQREDTRTYQRIAATTSVVIFDEGHYEPSPDWSRSVRGLGAPIVLLTATPYRNDLRLFDVDERFIYSLSHAEAEQMNFVRSVRFHEVSFHSVGEFCRALLRFYERTFPRAERARVIVRCDTKNSVTAVTTELARLHVSVVGIHDRYTPSDGPLLRRSVPDADDQNAPLFWVHQRKLIEGIDSTAFRMVAFFEPFQNDRAFVQQVGRVLRNPDQLPDQVSWVFSSPDHGLAATWSAYRRFDRLEREELFFNIANFVKGLPLHYLLGRFRDPFNLDDPEGMKAFTYPRATIAFLARDDDIKKLAKAIEREWSKEDLELGPIQEPDRNTRFLPYIAVRTSPLLARNAFPEFELGFTLYRRIRSYLFYFDSQGRTPFELQGRDRVPPATLERLYSGASARVANISLRNTSIGRHDVRRRTVQAFSVGELAPDLGDHMAFPSTARGVSHASNGSIVGRYVGFTRARVRDQESGINAFEDYAAWLDGLADALDDAGAPVLSLFERYAEVVPPPATPEAEHILLDFEQELFETAPAFGQPQTLRLDELAMQVSPDGSFTCVANGAPTPVRIQWIPQTSSYRLDSASLETRYVMRGTSARRRPDSLIAYLNREQAFRVVPRLAVGEHAVYAGGRFYRSRHALWGTARTTRVNVLNVLEAIPQLAVRGSEKGDPGVTRAAGTKWAVGSLFDLIDELGRDTGMNAHMAGINLLVCDDLGTEIADFLAVDSGGRRAIAIHAKGFGAQPKELSASAIHDISSQALKNLGYFQPYVLRNPSNLNKWNGDWEPQPGWRVRRRIRRGDVNAATAWGQIRSALRDPQYAREVWLVLGRGLSRDRLQTELAKARPRAEAIQLVYSLVATWSAVQAVGARLRVFCSPYVRAVRVRLLANSSGSRRTSSALLPNGRTRVSGCVGSDACRARRSE